MENQSSLKVLLINAIETSKTQTEIRSKEEEYRLTKLNLQELRKSFQKTADSYLEEQSAFTSISNVVLEKLKNIEDKRHHMWLKLKRLDKKIKFLSTYKLKVGKSNWRIMKFKRKKNIYGKLNTSEMLKKWKLARLRRYLKIEKAMQEVERETGKLYVMFCKKESELFFNEYSFLKKVNKCAKLEGEYLQLYLAGANNIVFNGVYESPVMDPAA